MPIVNYLIGLGKGVVFGMLIALVSCHFGLRIKPNTESLGRGTTTSVVTAITVVILADAVFAIVFSAAWGSDERHTPRSAAAPPQADRKPDEDVGPPVVQIRNLWTRFGRTVVHQDLNLDIYAGEILSIVGGSGTGKTVLLRQMLGLERPSSGTVHGVRRRHQQRQRRNSCSACATTGACCSSRARCIRR